MMRIVAIVIAAVGLTACGVMEKSGLPAAGAGGGPFPMPDVTGMTRVEAEAALRAQGIRGEISVDESYNCDDPKVSELRVCFTAPRAGQATSAKIPVVLYPRKKGTATYAMPDLRGKSADEARATLLRLGQIDERLEIETMRVILDDCKAQAVCRQDPAPGTLTDENDYKTLQVAPAE